MKLGIKIKNAREKKNLTQAELGIKIGLSKSEISRYERGNRVPRTIKLRALAETLDLKLEEMLEAVTEVVDSLRWGRIHGRPREVVYIPMYQNKVDSKEVCYNVISLGLVAAAGVKLSEGHYIWVVNAEGCKWIKYGTRLLVSKTNDICKGDLAAFLICDDWIWVGEVEECNGKLNLSFIFNDEVIFLDMKKACLLGKVIHLALDL